MSSDSDSARSDGGGEMTTSKKDLTDNFDDLDDFYHLKYHRCQAKKRGEQKNLMSSDSDSAGGVGGGEMATSKKDSTDNLDLFRQKCNFYLPFPSYPHETMSIKSKLEKNYWLHNYCEDRYREREYDKYFEYECYKFKNYVKYFHKKHCRHLREPIEKNLDPDNCATCAYARQFYANWALTGSSAIYGIGDKYLKILHQIYISENKCKAFRSVSNI